MTINPTMALIVTCCGNGFITIGSAQGAEETNAKLCAGPIELPMENLSGDGWQAYTNITIM